MTKNHLSSLSRPYDATLILSDGTMFQGYGVGHPQTSYGEICFHTGLTGYQETLTDPSFAGQIIVFTFPHIGNVGTNKNDNEAKKPATKGLVIREVITGPSNHRSQQHLDDWLKQHEITGISGIDTRALTRHIRVHGAQNIAIHYQADQSDSALSAIQKTLSSQPSLEGMELAKHVSRTQAEHMTGAADKYHVVAIDYGAKQHMLDCLVDHGCKVTVVPADTDSDAIMKLNPDGIFLSNGPGDPAATAQYALPVIQSLLEQHIPLFGICLGHQLLALALGCKTEKMHQGHRGSNQPVQDLTTSKVEITSQNHGFVVADASIPDDVEVTHRSLFDKSIEGVRSTRYPAFSVQYHPEASPGTHDSLYLFKRFIQLIDEQQA